VPLNTTIQRWLTFMWRPAVPRDIAQAYAITFNSFHGQIVLQHLLDNIYCRTSESSDPNVALAHDARRSVIQSILENIDIGQRPAKYVVPPPATVESNNGLV